MITFLLLLIAQCTCIYCETWKTSVPNMEAALLGYNPVIGNSLLEGRSDPGMRYQIFVGSTTNQYSEKDLASNIEVHDAVDFKIVAETSVVDNYQDYKSKKLSHVSSKEESGFSVSIKVPYVEASYKQDSSKSSSKDFDTESSFFANTLGEIFIHKYYGEVFNVKVNPYAKPIFKSNFITAMQQLNQAAKNPNSKTSKRNLKMFIDTYGTHYQSKSWLGASITTEVRSTSRSKGADDKQKKTDCIENAHSKSFSGGVDAGGFSIEAGHSLSKDLEKCFSDDNDNKIHSKNDFSKTKIISRGSAPIQDLNEWISVIKESPSVIRLEILPIKNLFTIDLIGKIPATDNETDEEYLDAERMYNYFDKAVENYCQTMFDRDCVTPKGCGINSNCTYLERCENDNSALGFKCVEDPGECSARKKTCVYSLGGRIGEEDCCELENSNCKEGTVVLVPDYFPEDGCFCRCLECEDEFECSNNYDYDYNVYITN